ncbi:hypothetical protein PAENIP36_38000 [Paenibacillus sp. P36]
MKKVIQNYKPILMQLLDLLIHQELSMKRLMQTTCTTYHIRSLNGLTDKLMKVAS